MRALRFDTWFFMQATLKEASNLGAVQNGIRASYREYSHMLSHDSKTVCSV